MKGKEDTFGHPFFSNRGRLRPITAVLLLLLLLLSYPCTAFLQQSEETLLQEIEKYIKLYYIYQPEEENFSLHSLEDLSEIFQDPHSAYLDRERMVAFQEGLERSLPGGVGIYLEQKDSEFFVTSVVPGCPADRAGIKSGDIIISVDGSSVSTLSLEEVVLRIRGEKESEVKLLICRDDTFFTFDMVREKIELPLAEFAWEDEGIALLKIYSFGDDLVNEVMPLLEELETTGLQGLILDLRDNSGGYVEEALAMCSLFTEGVLINVREKNSLWEEIRGPKMEEQEPLCLPMVVLVNGGTASAGEIMASALKDNKAAVLVGEVTFGKGTMQTLFRLGDGGCLKLTTAEFTSPHGRTIKDSGVEPQYVVLPEDEQLQVALDLLRCRLEEGKEKVAFLESAQINNQLFYPLRTALRQTGREIAAGDSPDIYFFYWDRQLYRLDLRERSITWNDYNGTRQRYPVFFHRGITYVQSKFLEDGLGLPIY